MSAGILNEEAKKNYLRYSQEYYTAWIKHLPQIAETIRKFDGKKVTKRITTAVEKIDSRLRFTFEKSSYGGGYIYFNWYDYNGRIFRDESTDEWDYVPDKCDMVMYRLDDMESFDTEGFISRLEGRAKQMMETKEETYAALDNLDKLKAEYNAALAAFNEAREKIPFSIRDFYRIDSHWLGEWR